MLECKIAQDLPLHSILVKSIRCNMTTERLSELPLHSILVKSIPEPIVVDIGWDRPLHSILVKSIRAPRVAEEVCLPPLHSILVKSIRLIISCVCPDKYLYIPFWLNLYADKLELDKVYDFFTFHSG